MLGITYDRMITIELSMGYKKYPETEAQYKNFNYIEQIIDNSTRIVNNLIF